ncbi:sugar transferase [Termitidicoccus mucosus]|uniref:Bacterial sugar transferase domain-containing protein n=1 Tax=Termitidicoccus mucosus TaxID=1184151 RepID=A0A178IEA4_9BACT|nr:hypothetical protein AW736_19265 [Opitutaceae bacterium TSB47]
MLKHRQEGLTTLHGLCVTLILGLLFMLWADVMRKTGFITFSANANLRLYLLAVVGGALLGSRHYRPAGKRLGYLSWMEILQITRRQLVRIALILFAVAFATKDTDISRLFLLSYLAAATVLLYILNATLPSALSRLFFKANTVRTLFIGPPSEVHRLRGWIVRQEHLGVEPVGYVSDEEPRAGDAAGASVLPALPRFGCTGDLKEVLAAHNIAQVVLLQFYVDREYSSKLIQAAQGFGCRVRIYNNLSTYYDHPVSVEDEGDYTFFTLNDEPLENPVNRILKRALDIAISLPVVVLVLPPLTFFVWLIQRIQSTGPIFYPQLRSGINKRRFHIWKFRTMHTASQTKEQERVQARQGDSRVYPFGRFLRRTSLDEMPQFINVLIGEMSVSGPRPHMIEHDEEFAKILRNYYSRHHVKPGITGLAQSMGLRGEISEVALLEKRIGYDLIYISKWSLLLDIKILFATVRQVIFPPKTAY